MFTPYDWQEGIGNRASYIEAKLAQGAPVLAVSLAEGILIATFRRQTRKVYEVYDRLIFAGIGQQSDVEALRTASLEFAHSEGYNRSEEDVTIGRVATALSGPIKRAFNDFSAAPFVARILFAEVNETPDEDLFYTIDFDGDFTVGRGSAVLAGTVEISESLAQSLSALDPNLEAEVAREQMEELWRGVVEPEAMEGLFPEVVLLERSDVRENRFRLLTPEVF